MTSKADPQNNAPSGDISEQFRDAAFGASKLKGIALFARFTEGELAKLYSMGEIIKLKPKSHAVIEGEPTRGMYILLAGTVSVYKTDQATNSMNRLAILEEGANFGELSLFDNAPRSATVLAENQCILFHLPAEGFKTFLDAEGADLQIRFYRTCAENLVERFRLLNTDYMISQQLLWKYALRKDGNPPQPEVHGTALVTPPPPPPNPERVLRQISDKS